MTQRWSKLPHGADQLLQRFPSPEPDFERQAETIAARIAAGDTSVAGGLDDLLAAPGLAPEPGEPGSVSPVQGGAVPKSNFAEMARKSLQKKDDDASLAKELLAVAAAQSRRPDAQMVERVRAAGRSAAASTPLAVGARPPSAATHAPPAEDVPRPSGVVARAPMTSAVATRPTSPNRGTIIGIVGATFGIAACIALFVKGGTDEEPTAVGVLAAERKSEPTAAPVPRPVQSATSIRAPDAVLSPESLAATPEPAAPRSADKTSRSAAPVGSVLAAKVAATPSAGKSSALTEAVVLEDDPEPKPAEPRVTAVAEPMLKPAQGANGDIPLSPSAGAVSTALNSVRGGAQACLAGQSESVTATVTFAADGHVLRVTASGPSGPCIQAALAKAHVAPFARESFSASTTIRPP